MVCAGFLIVPTLGYGALILRYALGGAGVSTLGGAGSPTIHAGDVCTTLGVATFFQVGLKHDCKLS